MLNIQKGPKGGMYIVSPSGKKRYVSPEDLAKAKGKKGKKSKPASEKKFKIKYEDIKLSKKGVPYVITKSGKKRYIKKDTYAFLKKEHEDTLSKVGAAKKDAGVDTLSKLSAAKKGGGNTFEVTDRPAGGSQGGKWYKDEQGEYWFGKQYESNLSGMPQVDRMESEHFANNLYSTFGVKVPETKLEKINGKTTLMSKELKGKEVGQAGLEKSDLKDNFVVDAWLGNRDVVGLTYDNALVDKDGKALRVDNGASLTYRAMGGKKDFGPEATELHSMRDPKYPAGKVFGKLSDDEIASQIDKFEKTYKANKSAIDKMVDEQLGAMDSHEREQIKKNLHKRAEYIISEKSKFAKKPEAKTKTAAKAPLNDSGKPKKFKIKYEDLHFSDSGAAYVITKSGKKRYVKKSTADYLKAQHAGGKAPAPSKSAKKLSFDELQAKSNEIIGSLKFSEQKAIKHYTGNSYEVINGKLRNPPPGPGTQKKINAIDKALAKSKLDGEVTTFRGLDGRYINHLKEGDVYSDKAFVSTSVDEKKALSFSKSHYEGGKTKGPAAMMKIRVPPGAKALYVQKISQHSHEKELLLPRGAKFKINGYTTVEKHMYSGYTKTVKVYDVELIIDEE